MWIKHGGEKYQISEVLTELCGWKLKTGEADGELMLVLQRISLSLISFFPVSFSSATSQPRRTNDRGRSQHETTTQFSRYRRARVSHGSGCDGITNAHPSTFVQFRRRCEHQADVPTVGITVDVDLVAQSMRARKRPHFQKLRYHHRLETKRGH